MMKQKLRALEQRVPWRRFVKDYVYLTIGAFGIAINFNLFMAPARLAPGGATGIALIVNNFTGWPNGLILTGLSLPLLVLGFKFLGRFRFLPRTLYLTMFSNFLIDFLPRWLPADGLTDDPLLNVVFGGVMGGIGYGIILRGRGISAGTGIVSRILQLKTGLPSSQVYMMVDGGIIAVLGLTFGWESALYGLVMLFIYGLATDYMLEGPSVIRTVFIITDAPHAVSQALIRQLHIGVTSWNARGMFTNQDHATLFCTVRRTDVTTVRLLVEQYDPQAFIVIGQGHQAMGGMWQTAVENITEV